VRPAVKIQDFLTGFAVSDNKRAGLLLITALQLVILLVVPVEPLALDFSFKWSSLPTLFPFKLLKPTGMLSSAVVIAATLLVD
jgi:hypothetical protein